MRYSYVYTRRPRAAVAGALAIRLMDLLLGGQPAALRIPHPDGMPHRSRIVSPRDTTL
jgi:hypothetical protein